MSSFPKEFFQRPNATKREPKFCRNFEPKQKTKRNKTMNIYLIKNGQNAGPYSESEVTARIRGGLYGNNDLAWCDGCNEPVPLNEVLSKLSQQQASPQAGFSAAELIVIAVNSRNLLLLAVGWIAVCILPCPDYLTQTCGLVVLGCWIRFGWQLAHALHGKPWVWVVWSLIPLGNIYALVRILCTSVKTLKANGVPVGILGADRIALDRLAAQARLQTQI
jgi:hypothetical protein